MPNDTSTNTTSASQGDQTSSTSAHGATSTSQGDQSSTTTSTRSVEELERLNAELLRDNAGYRRKAKEQADATAAAEQARLTEQGQFKELATKHENRVKALEPIAESYTKLAEQINAQIETEINLWPAEVKNLVPGSDIPAEQRLEQMTKLRPLLDKLQTQARTQLPGNRPNPQVATPAATKQAQLEANKAALMKQHGYSHI